MVSRGRAQHRIEAEPAFLLHAIAYRETSLIVELLTRNHGRIAAVARGAKRPHSSLRAVLMSFQPLNVCYGGVRDLRNLIDAQWLGGLAAPQGDALLCAFYANELLMKLLAREDAHPLLFDGYLRMLTRLGHGEPLEPVMRQFEWLLLRETGYGIDLQRDSANRPIDESARYRLRIGVGFDRVGVAEANTIAGQTLVALAEDRLDDANVLLEAKALTRAILSHQLAGHVLVTRKILIDLQKL
jgi:DNA repair protein RecO (recombination protein O)